MPSYSRVANGNIKPYRFVKQDTTAVGRVLQCTGNTDSIFGVSQEGTHLLPGDLGIDDGFAAVAGENLNVYGPPAKDIILCIGGTVTQGDRLTSEADGRGVSTTTTGQEWGAVALMSGVSGDLIRAQLVKSSVI